ncbi:MAG: hypothetical protein ACRDMV_17960 [Streptosporangiales bacterium]
MRFVTMYHPKVGEASVPESAVPHHERAGWRRDRPKSKASKAKVTDTPAHERPEESGESAGEAEQAS